MKKFFTLAAISLMAIGAYAQDENPKAESWYVNDEDGNLKDVYVANSESSAMSVVEFSTENVTGTHTSGPNAGFEDSYDPDNDYLEPKIDNSWDKIVPKELSKDGSVPYYYYVQGKGNPVVDIDAVTSTEVPDDNGDFSHWTADWDNAYYQPDGSKGLPTNGTYITLTPKVKGTLKVAVWINKGNRKTYVVPASTGKALAPNTEVAASGYVNGTNWGDDEVAEDSPLYGYPMLQESIEFSSEEGKEYVIGAGTQQIWGYLTFSADANETYYIFHDNSQIGFSGFEFTYEDDGTNDDGDGDGDEGGDKGTTSEVDSWYITNADGTLKDVYVPNIDETAMSVVEFSTNKVEGTHTSGPIAGYKDSYDPDDDNLEPTVDNTWQNLKTLLLSADGSIAPFYSIQGKGNPVDLSQVEVEKVTDENTGEFKCYRAYWDNAYYQPDGSKGLPTNGTYVTLKPSVDGTFTVAVWINKDNREVFIAKGSDGKALSYAKGEATISGYLESTKYTDSEVSEDSPVYDYPMYFEDLTPTYDEDGNEIYYINTGTQYADVYITFKADAKETYYIFHKNSQIGFSGFEFEYEDDGTGDTDSINEVIVKEDNPNAPIYNLAGQRVTKNAKGILIQNGKKFIAK